ncbi:MAG: hypothetical protein HY537_01450 [Deltaproteobacteria bacterium]|nr:hypothetical protein [Deltaproteobacteria bacterium]
MIKKLIKLAFFVSVVLLLGQIRLGKRSIAEHFHQQVTTLWHWSNQKIMVYRSKSAWLDNPNFSQMLGSVGSFFTVKKATPKNSATYQPKEQISNADSEALMRLLDQ